VLAQGYTLQAPRDSRVDVRRGVGGGGARNMGLPAYGDEFDIGPGV